MLSIWAQFGPETTVFRKWRQNMFKRYLKSEQTAGWTDTRTDISTYRKNWPRGLILWKRWFSFKGKRHNGSWWYLILIFSRLRWHQPFKFITCFIKAFWTEPWRQRPAARVRTAGAFHRCHTVHIPCSWENKYNSRHTRWHHPSGVVAGEIDG